MLSEAPFAQALDAPRDLATHSGPQDLHLALGAPEALPPFSLSNKNDFKAPRAEALRASVGQSA